MNRTDRFYFTALIVIMALAGVAFYFLLEEERECTARGGTMIKTVFGTECVEIKRLK
jgi:hypothetical protein